MPYVVMIPKAFMDHEPPPKSQFVLRALGPMRYAPLDFPTSVAAADLPSSTPECGHG